MASRFLKITILAICVAKSQEEICLDGEKRRIDWFQCLGVGHLGDAGKVPGKDILSFELFNTMDWMGENR